MHGGGPSCSDAPKQAMGSPMWTKIPGQTKHFPEKNNTGHNMTDFHKQLLFFCAFPKIYTFPQGRSTELPKMGLPTGQNLNVIGITQCLNVLNIGNTAVQAALDFAHGSWEALLHPGFVG